MILDHMENHRLSAIERMLEIDHPNQGLPFFQMWQLKCQAIAVTVEVTYSQNWSASLT